MDFTTKFNSAAWIEIYFPTKVSKVDFLAEPIAGWRADYCDEHELRGDDVKRGVVTAGDFVGIQRPAADIGGLKITLNDKGFTIDNFTTGGASSVGSVPEPGTLALLGLGLTGLAWLRPLLHCDLSMAATIEFRNVSYQIAGRPILRNVTFSVGSAETLVLLGRSGSGKTTALRMVNALAYPTEGEVLVEGKPTTAWDPVALRRGIGYVIQEGGLFPHWSVAANVGLAPRLQNWPAQKREERVRELLIMIGLPLADYGDRRPRQLSGGQKQRVGVARALAADPPILLFDEPFGAVDPITRLELQRMFLSLRNQLSKAALFVTHDVAEALMLGTRIALLNAGTLAWIGPSKTFRDASLEEARAFLACLGERNA